MLAQNGGTMPEHLDIQKPAFDLQDDPVDTLSVLYVDEYRLSRESVTALLATHLSNLKIESVASVYDLPPDGDINRFRFAILHTHAARVGEHKIAVQVARMARCFPVVPFVLISDVEDPDVIVEAFQLGARGYITTAQSWLEAADAIQFVDSGGVAAPWNRLTASDRSAVTAPGRAADIRPLVKFTARQIDVLTCLRQGKPNKTIAFELGMSESTVKVHIRQIMDKLHASNRTQVALFAHGLAEKRTG